VDFARPGRPRDSRRDAGATFPTLRPLEC